MGYHSCVTGICRQMRVFWFLCGTRGRSCCGFYRTVGPMCLATAAKKSSPIPLDWGFCYMAGALHRCVSEPMVNSLGGSARLSSCQTSSSDSVRDKVSWPEVRGWGPHSEIGFSGNQFLMLKVQLCQSRSPFSPLSSILALLDACLLVRFLVEIIAMLDEIWVTPSKEVCGYLGEGACSIKAASTEMLTWR